MNKKYSLLAAVLSIFTLVSCNEGVNETQIANENKIKTAINSLRKTTHRVNLEQSATILRPNDNLSVDFTNIYKFTHTHYYGENTRAFSTKSTSTYYDMDKVTHEIIQSTYRTHDNDEKLYFKLDNGYAELQDINFQNKLETAISAYYDEETNRYTPIMFDTEFRNPFDFISYRDVVVNTDGTLSLINQKIDFLLDCYNAVGMNTVKENYLKLNDKGEITSIDFVIPDQYGTENQYVRSNTISLTYDGRELETKVLAPYTNNNPELQAAFDSIKDKKNYTYTKTYLQQKQVDGTIKDHSIKGYFTEDVVYFHHHETSTDTHPYEGGDDYDYKAVKQANGTYYVYQYSMATDTYGWGIVMASTTTPLIYNTFEEIGPLFPTIDASIFKKTGENTYVIEDYLLSRSGGYFDFQMMGVGSDAFKTGTTKCEVTLNEDGSIKQIDSNFKFLTETFTVRFTLQDIGTTVVPSYAL